MKEQDNKTPDFNRMFDSDISLSPELLIEIADGWDLDYPEAGENNPALKKKQNQEVKEPQPGE